MKLIVNAVFMFLASPSRLRGSVPCFMVSVPCDSVALRAYSLIEHRCFLNQTNNAWLLVLITRKYVNLFKLSCTQICNISLKPNGNMRLAAFNTHMSNDDQPTSLLLHQHIVEALERGSEYPLCLKKYSLSLYFVSMPISYS